MICFNSMALVVLKEVSGFGIARVLEYLAQEIQYVRGDLKVL